MDVGSLVTRLCQELQKERHLEEDTKHIMSEIIAIFEKAETADAPEIVGSSFATVPENFNQEMADQLYESLISLNHVMDADEKMVVIVLSHIAAFNFRHFVERHASRLLTTDIIRLERIPALLCRVILDPATGFLRNAALSPMNGKWEKDHRFNFFRVDSPCLQTPFGRALTQFRDLVHNFIMTKCVVLLENDGMSKFGMFVSSPLQFLQAIIVPPTFRSHDIACGFPTRVEVLFLCSRFMEGYIYMKRKKQERNLQSMALVEAWASLFDSWDASTCRKMTGGEFCFPERAMSPKFWKMQFIKLSLFLIVEGSPAVEDYKRLSLLPIILGGDINDAMFCVLWIEMMLFVLPEVSFKLFDDIFAMYDRLYELSYPQLFNYLHAITRFVDVMGLLPTRYLDDEHMSVLMSIAVAGLISPHPKVRCAGYKLCRVMGNFESDGQSGILISLIRENEKLIQQQMYNRFEKVAFNVGGDGKHTKLAPMTFAEVLTTDDLALWDMVVARLAVLLSECIPYPLIVSEKRRWLKDLRSTKSNQNLDVERMLMIFAYVGPLSDFPFQFKDVSDVVKESRQLSLQIIEEMIDAVQKHWRNRSSVVRNMLAYVNTAAFPTVVETLKKLNPEREVVAILLRAMSWSDDFSAVSEHQEFFLDFLDVFGRSFVEMGELCGIMSVEMSEWEVTIADELVQFCFDLLATFYMILSVAYASRLKDEKSVYPCYATADPAKFPVIAGTMQFFAPLWNLAKGARVPKELKDYAARVLEVWIACNPVPNLYLIWNKTLMHQLEGVAKERPRILLFLLSHHFCLLFSQYIHAAYYDGNEAYFLAISAFFKSDGMNAANTPAMVLGGLYMSWVDVQNGEKLMQDLSVVYENCGSLILVCLYFLSRGLNKTVTEQAFILLASLAPIMSLYRMKGRDDDVSKLVNVFFQICDKVDQNLTCIGVEHLTQISEVLCESFTFCIEQLIFDTCSHMPRRNDVVTDRMLAILSPWFCMVDIDYENRVISKETDLLFMKFSCFSFVYTLMVSFSDVANDDISCPLFSTWKALVTIDGVPNSNFLPVLLSVIYSSHALRNHSAAVVIIHYLFRIAPQMTSDPLASLLSCAQAIHYHVRDGDDGGSFDTLSSDDDSSGGGDDDLFISRNCRNLYIFIIGVIHQLVMDSVRPFIPSLPTIFVHCLIYLDEYRAKIVQLIQSIINELLPLIEEPCVEPAEEILRLCGTIEGEEVTEVPRATVIELSRVMTDLLRALDPKMAEQMGLELLQWGFCYGDVSLSARAILCYAGNMTFVDWSVVGLTARTLWYVSEAAAILAHEKDDTFEDYVVYMAEHTKNLKCIAEAFAESDMLGTDSSLIWIAVEAMKCNIRGCGVLFTAGLELFEFIVGLPELFRFLVVPENHTRKMMTPGVFCKFHEPWGDVFHGVASYIYGCQCEDVDADRLIHVLNLSIQTGYRPLLSDAANFTYVALLSLLPWMWSVTITHVSRFFDDSPAVQMMEATIAVLSKWIGDDDITARLKSMTARDTDMYQEGAKMCSVIVPMISTDNLVMLGKFFTTCLKYGRKSLRGPLYAVVASIAKFAADRAVFVNCLGEFAEIVARNKDEYRKVYRRLFDQTISGFTFTAPADTGSDRLVFSNLDLYERIVAVVIPHMYELNAFDVNSININDMNSFPPLLPFDKRVLVNEKFGVLFSMLQQHRFEPFASWTELSNKLQTSIMSLIDGEDLESMKITLTVEELNAPPALINAMKSISVSTPVEAEEYAAPSRNASVEMFPVEDEPAGDPYTFVFIEPMAFVPTVDDANIVADDIFGNEAALSVEGEQY